VSDAKPEVALYSAVPLLFM